MQYALLIYAASAPEASASASVDTSPADYVGAPEQWIAYTRALKSAGALIALQRLQSVDTATSVRVRDGEQLLTDGPFIETKEHLLGFYLVEAPNLDAALDWAARMPLSRFGTVEVRPVLPTPVLDQIVRE
ncbi:MAG TPA: YciI family protein [Ktedonobacterales bacterium]|nr:YciI family protein [Ktedonobacterales bacterium]